MPKGVDHSPAAVAVICKSSRVQKSLMPKGVDHLIPRNDSFTFDAKVQKSLMPKGVDHSSVRNTSLPSLIGCAKIFDAERR